MAAAPPPSERPDRRVRGSGTSPDPVVDPGLREAVARRVTADPGVAAAPGDRVVLRRSVARALAAEGLVVGPTRWAAVVQSLVDHLGGLGPLEPLLRDPDVTDVMCNGPHEVWVDRGGRLRRVEADVGGDTALVALLRRVLGPLGVRLDRAHPFADAVLQGGIRLHALIPPLAERPLVTLRRVPAVVPTWEELVAGGSLTPEVVDRLRGAVADRRNLVVCGRAAVGKTTLLGRLLSEVDGDRVVIIEDAPELAVPDGHTVHLRVRPPTPDGIGGVDVATLVRNALRMRPDRLVVGEVRGAEVADMLQAMNTGHAGSLTTVHANGAADALVRLEGMALLAGLPLDAVRAQLASALDLVVGLDRGRDGVRRVARIVEVSGGPRQLRARTVWP